MSNDKNPIPVRILVLEDNPADAEMEIEILRSSNFEPEWKRVETKQDYIQALESHYDLILADYTLPQFTAKEAFDILKEKQSNIPFIIISGTIVEETGILLMREGVRDYISKDRIKRLGESVRLTLEHKKMEDEKKKSEAALTQSELLFKQFAENSFDVLWMASATNDEIFFISSSFEKIWGIPAQVTGYKRSGWLETIHPEDRPKISQAFAVGSALYTKFPYLEYRIRRGDGCVRWIRDHSFEVKNEKGVVYRLGGIARDITSLKINELRRELRHNIALILVQYNTLEECAPKLIEVICELMKWRIGIFWVVDLETNAASYFASWQKEDGRLDAFVKSCGDLIFQSEKGFVGKLLAKKEAIFVKNIVDSDYFLQKEAARQADLIDVLGFPIYLRGQNYGVIEFFHTSIEGIDPAWLVLFNDIAKQIGLFIERKNAEKALIESEERFRSSFENAAIGIALISLEGDFFQVNNSFCEILGFKKEEILTKNFKEITHKEDLIKESTYQRQILTNELQIYRTDKRFITKDKSLLWASVSSHLLHDLQNNPLYFIYEVQDISQRKRMEEKLVHLAYYDMLTGLPNKRLLEDTVNQTLLDASLREEKVTIFFININHFKQINDLVGPELGDYILKQLALRLNERIPFKDIVGRWSGDEFVLVVANPMSKESRALFAKKILSYIKEPIVLSEKRFFLSASIGIAIFPDDGSQTQGLLKNAYLAMNLARKEGIDNFKFYSNEFLKEEEEKALLENHLRKAIAQKELALHYQPIVDVQSGKITGAEALLRWNSKELGSISPNKFIPIAEESGLIVPIGEWALEEGIKTAKQWEQEGLQIVLAINLSVLQLKQVDFIDFVERILQETALNPAFLRLEIIESQLMQNKQEVIEKINILRKKKIQIAIDDFGTGYSSFSYLHDFVFEYFKIDSSFICHIDTDQKNAQIVQAIIAMSDALGMSTIAEGVETKEEFETLKRLNCKEIQGYYFSYPLPLKEFQEKFFQQKPF